MTYNIRGYFPCDNLKNPSEHWYYRKNHIIDIIKKEQPDILALQEVFNIASKVQSRCNKKVYIGGYSYDALIKQDIKELSQNGIRIDPPKHLMRDFIREKLKKMGYSYFYKAGGSPKMIFYKKNKFTFVSGGQFYQRKGKSTTYLFLKDKNNKVFLVVNTHLIAGKKYKKDREKSLHYITKRLLEINKKGYPVIVVGDFNIEQNSDAYSKLVKLFSHQLGLVDTGSEQMQVSTFHAYGSQDKKLDYIFHTKEIKLVSTKVARIIYDNKKQQLSFYKKSNNILFPSDHWPLVCKFDLE